MKIIFILILIALGFGGYWYFIHKPNINNVVNNIDINSVVNNINEVKNNVVTKTNADIDAIIKSTLSGVSSISPLYYLQNGRNYGLSATQNICTNSKSKGSLGNIISSIQQYTKAVTCVVDPNFPSKSFTIIAPSLINKGLSYCTDQAGFFMISLTSNSSYKAGFKCK